LREPTIARNYAAALFESGEQLGKTELFADLIDGLAGAIEADTVIQVALETPRVPKAVKQEILRRALADYAPDEFVRFLGAVVKRGRQNILRSIATEYASLVDAKFNRVHAGITLARQPDELLQQAIRDKLSQVLARDVIPHYRINPAILGGIQVRVGDVSMDGSVRRKMKALRRSMLKG
jgi:F-type H+-transporting ATPase subunit delta